MSEDMDSPPPPPQEGTKPRWHLSMSLADLCGTFDLQISDIINVCYLGHQVSGNLLWQPKEANTDGEILGNRSQFLLIFAPSQGLRLRDGHREGGGWKGVMDLICFGALISPMGKANTD